MKFKKYLSEISFNTNVKYRSKSSGDKWFGSFQIDDVEYSFSFKPSQKDGVPDFDFDIDSDDLGAEQYALSNKGQAIDVFGVAKNIIVDYVKHNDSEEFKFGASLDQPSRVKLYDRFSNMLAKHIGYSLNTKKVNGYMYYHFKK